MKVLSHGSSPVSFPFHAAFPLLRTAGAGEDKDGANAAAEKQEKLWSLMSSYLASGTCGHVYINQLQ